MERKHDVRDTKIWKLKDPLVKCENIWKRQFKNTTLWQHNNFSDITSALGTVNRKAKFTFWNIQNIKNVSAKSTVRLLLRKYWIAENQIWILIPRFQGLWNEMCHVACSRWFLHWWSGRNIYKRKWRHCSVTRSEKYLVTLEFQVSLPTYLYKNFQQ